MKLALAALVLVGCTNDPGVELPPEGPPADAAPDAAQGLVPTGLTFSFLPIDTLRGEVSGHDVAADVCVRVIWDFSNNGRDLGRHCDEFFATFPYVVLAPGDCGGQNVPYQGNVDLVSGSGCFDFRTDAAASSVDLVLQVSGPAYTGAITLKSE